MSKKTGNDKKHPEAWNFYIKQAKNISETELNYLGNYRIPVPDMSGDFIYTQTVEELWDKFIQSWYRIESLNAPTIKGKIQYIVKNLNH